MLFDIRLGRAQALVIAASMLSGGLALAAAGCTETDGRRRPDGSRPSGDVDSGGPIPGVDSGPRPVFDAGPPACHGGDDDDIDEDGFTPAQGDCYDCSAQVNPAAFDDPSNTVDEDCDGTPATMAEQCDTGLAIDSGDPQDAARAIGLCRFITETETGWGVISARYTRADGTAMPASPLQHGLLSSLGSVSSRVGNAMLSISSGAARAPGQAGYTTACDEYTTGPSGGPPAGLDPDSPACPGVVSGAVYDPVALEVRIRVPSNAEGFRFESNFFTYEYPNYICSEYNDFFVVVMEPRPAGSSDGNIVFDVDGNKVSVNNSLLRACAPGTHGGRTFACPLGVGPLAATSFDDTAECGVEGIPGFPFPFPGSDAEVGASTGWLRTEAPVEGGSIITLRFAAWDAGDPTLDSLALIDAFEWLLEDPGMVHTDPILF
ncbi:MAG: hypothetical protein M3Y87_01580 [Myxococcota bacterium]|nr:hypothetical protein [Myxococcota bacterium]